MLMGAFDAAGAALSGVGAWLAWTEVLDREFFPWQGVLLAVLGALWVVGLSGSMVLGNRLHRSLLDDLPSILQRVLLVSAVVALAVSVLWLDPDRAGVVLVATALGGVILTATRGLSYVWLAHRRGGARRRVLIIGAGRVGAQVADLLSKNRQPSMEVVGFLDKEPLERAEDEAEAGVPVLGSSYDLHRVVGEYGIGKIIIAFSKAPHHRILEIIWECDRLGVEVSVVPRLFEATTLQSNVENVGGMPLMHLSRVKLVGYNAAIKRAFDILATAAGLLVIWPVLATVALAVKLDSPGSVIFAQERAGGDGKVFTMYKFRSMNVGAQNQSNYTVLGDPRRTRVGKYLRATSLDELPQLWNVLKGDMSLVGPRPEVWDRSQELAMTVHRYAHRYRVKSGVTGWAQANGLRGDTSIAERVVFDNHYIENWSLWLDIKIILLTLFKAWISKPERSAVPEDERLKAYSVGRVSPYGRVSDMKRSVSRHSTVAVVGDQVSSDLGEEVVILDVNAGLYYGLDAVGARVWSLLQEPRTVLEVRDVLLEEYDVEPERCERDVLDLLQQFAGEGLIDVRNGTPS